MKILHINCNYASTGLHKIMTSNLINEDTDVTVFVPVSQSWKDNYSNSSNELIISCFNNIDRFFFFRKQGKIFRALKKSIKKFDNYDLVHAFTLFTDGNIAYKLYKKYGIPYVVAIRDTDVNVFFKYRPYLRQLGREILYNAKAVFFLSEPYKDIVINRYINLKYRTLIKSKALVIPNGIDNFWLENRYVNRDYKDTISRISKKSIVILCVAKVCKRKNIPMLQKGITKLNSMGWSIKLIVVGKAEDKNLLNEIMNKDTIYYPAMEKEKLIVLYRKADLFALASHTETFGLVYAEALSQGLPVLYTKGQGFDGQFKNGEVGFSVDDKSSEDIAKAIVKICNHYQDITHSITDKIDKFDWGKICEKYRSIYRKNESIL